MTKIGIIVGSTRPGRFGVQPARWLLDLANRRGDAEYVLVDIDAAGLPIFDEPVPPAMRQPLHGHTKAWAATIEPLDGFVFITPEYNHSTSGALKNALDFIFHEWNDKPAAFLSYGSAAGGSRAVEHLRGIMAELKVFDIRDQVLLPDYWTRMDDQGQYQFSEAEGKSASAMLDELVFWAEQMRVARAVRSEGALVGAR